MEICEEVKTILILRHKTNQLKKYMKRLLLSMLVALSSQGIWAQSQTVKGTVVDKTGEPVIGATVQVKGTKIAVVTDLDGRFTLSGIPEGSIVDVSYIGMKS